MPLTIAYISSAFLADCDLPLIQEMTRQGVEIYYFLQMSDSSRQATLINVKKMKPKGGVFSATEYPDLAHLATYLPLDHIFVVNLPRPKDLDWQSFKATLHFYWMISKGNFDVLHVTNPLRYGSFLLYLFRRKMVLTMHDPLPHSSDCNFLNRMHRWVAFRVVNHFIVLSQSLLQDFIDAYGLQKKQVYLSQLGVYTHLLHTVPTPLELPESYVLFVGSINPHKGIRYLCDAMLQLRDKGCNLRLIIAGRGKFDFDIKSYMANGFISLINRYVTDGELVTLVRNSMLVCCPYIDATQSGVVMSSFALDKPVVATKVGALAEMITEGRHGFLVPPADVQALASAIQELANRPICLNEMSVAIHEDYSHGCRSWCNIAKKTIEIYHNVLL